MMKEKDTIQIIIAIHKEYSVPADAYMYDETKSVEENISCSINNLYLPLHVGAEGKFDENGNPINLGFMKDNTGDNISNKNASFCEITGIYWAWKNLHADYIGLVHYRRYFAVRKKRDDAFSAVLNRNDVEDLCKKYKIVVPVKRRYYIESLYSHYAHTHYASQLDATRDILEEKFPEYLASFDDVLRQSSGYMFNMMIMQRQLFNHYCEWLMSILFELEKRIDMPELSFYQGRFFGRIAEIIFNVWLNYQVKQGIVSKNEIKEVPCIHMEKINWWKKGTSFLKAKFLGKKYEGSF